MWNIFRELGPHKRGYRLEVPMEHITKTVEYLISHLDDNGVASAGVSKADIKEAIEQSAYQGHMAAISYALEGESKLTQ
jgi:hypothetical protein